MFADSAKKKMNCLAISKEVSNENNTRWLAGTKNTRRPVGLLRSCVDLLNHEEVWLDSFAPKTAKCSRFGTATRVVALVFTLSSQNKKKHEMRLVRVCGQLTWIRGGESSGMGSTSADPSCKLGCSSADDLLSGVVVVLLVLLDTVGERESTVVGDLLSGTGGEAGVAARMVSRVSDLVSSAANT